MAIYADRVKETTATVGTGTYSLAGAVTGFRTFVAGVTSGQVVTYCADDGTNWEIGEGTVTSGAPDTLTRTTIIASSNAGAVVTWGAGTKNIYLTASAGRLATLDKANTYTQIQTLPVGSTVPTAPVASNDASLANTNFVKTTTIPNTGTIGASVDFNTLTTSGIYYQNSDAQQATCTNTPTGFAGMLVVSSAVPSGGGIGIWQTYTTYSHSGIVNSFVRQFYSASWSVWKELAYVNSPTFTGTVTLPQGSIAPGLLGSTTATGTAAGTNQATATALVSDINILTTVAAGTGVVVPGATSGKYAVIVNRGANPLLVYPAAGHAFDGLVANAAITLPVNGFLEMFGSSTTQWHTTINAIINASAIQGAVAVANGGTGATTATGAKAALAIVGTDISTLRTNAATDLETCKEMRWKNYGSNHTIFDASASTAPNGAAINSTNSTSLWTATYPTLMGWNGTQTYGVRVDTARYAETSAPVHNRVKTDGITSGGYGSIAITGTTNTWAGINFPEQAITFMTNAAQQGVFANNTTWLWYGTSAGDFTAAGNVTAYSDERLKENWQPIQEDFIDLWARVKHGIYDRIDNKTTQIGLSAQAVQRVLPQAVVVNTDGFLTLNYGAAAGVATVKLAEKAMEQDAIIKKLIERIEALEAL